MSVNIIVDVESDGECPGLFSMVSFGVAFNTKNGPKTYYSDVLQPLQNADWNPDALAVSGISREEQLAGIDPFIAMKGFKLFLDEQAKLNNDNHWIFWSDNLAFDWQFINYYFHLYKLGNPFGFSGRRIGDLYAGAVKDIRAASKWKKYRVTPHTHNPADDALGNLEALNTIRKLHFNE